MQKEKGTMCSGPDNRSDRKLTPPGFAMDGSDAFQQQNMSPSYCSILLEFSASDDVISFKHAVEDQGADIDGVSYWYGRRIGSRKMGLEQRTPLLIAALFGSVEVLKYILCRGVVDVNRSCGSDGATALHSAAAGGSAVGSEIVKLLLDASADMEVLDANGKRAGDVIAPTSPVMKPKELEKLLKGEEEGLVSSVFTDATGNSEDKQQQTEQISEKKEYPIDLSLPDIKNGIYGTDEFRMYTFKVKPCSRAYSHDWTECPFVHPGENARRRDPRKYHYSCVPCPEFRKGTCRQGDACEYAHGVFECWLHPAQYRTRLCKDETGCTRRVCFFAHKKEELRPLYPSTGSAVLSPRGMGSSGSSLDMASMSPLALAGSLMLPTSTPPMSPSSSPSTIGGAGWQNQLPPTLQLPGSRLKASLNARDFELDMDLVGLDGHQQQQLMDEISTVSGRPNALAAAAALAAMSGSRSGKFNHIGVSPANLDDMFESVDSSSLSQRQGLSLKAAAAAAASASQFQSAASASLYQSPTHARQNMNQQLHSSFGSSLSSSPVRTSSSFGLDPSSAVAAAVMNSRAAAFAKRSQSFSERAAAATINRHPGLTAMATTSMATPSMLSDWGSPNGKLDWGIQGEELNKLRKSASFATRTSSGSAAAPASMGTALDEPDISWVQSLVKDTPSAGWLGSPPREQQQQYHLNLDEFQAASEMLSPWSEQLYMEQEQMVA